MYVFGDNCNSAMTGVIARNGKLVAQRDIGEVESLTTFGEDPQGELYAVTRDGAVSQLFVR